MKIYPEDLNTSFPEEIVHFQEYMNELESDMWQSEKGENKGTFIGLRMLQTIVNNEMQSTFPFVYTFTCHFSSQTVLERYFSALKRRGWGGSLPQTSES